MEEVTGIQRAVDKAGSPAKLADLIGNGVLRQHVEHWLKAGRVSAERTPDVSAATGVPPEELNDRVNWSLIRSGDAGEAATDAPAPAEDPPSEVQTEPGMAA